ncbi:hypothetical protein ACFOGG_13225 [Brenneria rubrifaciens]
MRGKAITTAEPCPKSSSVREPSYQRKLNGHYLRPHVGMMGLGKS